MAAKLTVVKQGSPASGPPRKLGKHGMALWQSVNSEYAIEDCGGREMLALACASLDRAESCRELIDKDGEVIKSKAGWREHPSCKTELANRAFVVRTLARLGLDVEAVRGVGRPAGRF
jgi:hypothetical protein